MLGETIEARIDALNKQKKEVALEWLEVFGGASEWKPETVISQLSRLVNEKEQGVRFFFEDPARSRALFAVLSIDDEVEADRLRSLADDVLDPQSQPPKVVVDLTHLAIEKDGLGGHIAARFLTDALKPRLAFVLTETQVHHLTLTYAEARLEKVPDAAAAAAVLAAFVEQGALLVGPVQAGAPLARWAALEVGPDGVKVEPADADQVYLRNGALPVSGPPAHPLAALADELPADHGTRDLPALGGPAMRRRLMMRLPAPSAQLARYRVASRLEMARELGVEAGATAEEAALAARLKAEREAREAKARAEREAREAYARETTRLTTLLKAAGLEKPTRAKAEAVAEAVERAGRRPASDGFWVVGDVFHVLNPSDGTLVADAGPRLEVHVVECPVPAIRVVRARVAAMTAEQFAQDPLLVGLVAAMLAKGTHDERALRHAADTLIAHPQFEPPAAGARVADPVELVRALLTEPCPAAALKVRLPLKLEEKAGEWDGPRYRERSRDIYVKALTWSSSVGWRHSRARVPRGAFWFTRTLGTAEVLGGRDHDLNYGHKPNERFVVPVDYGLSDETKWLDALELDFVGQTPRVADPQQAPDGTWAAADLHLAMLWDALRRAWDRETPTALHDGRWLIPLGGGLLAQFSVREHPVDGPVGGALVMPEWDEWGRIDWSALTRTASVWHASFSGSYSPNSMDMGAAVPHGVVLTGHGIAVELEIVASPYRQGSPFG